MPKYTLRLIRQGSPLEDKEIQAEGILPEEDDELFEHKEYPRCTVKYKIRKKREHHLDMLKDPLPLYQLRTIVSADRVSSKQYPFKKK